MIFCVNYSYSQDYIIPLWEGRIPNSKKSNLVEIQKNPTARSISKVTIPTLEVYLPSSVIETKKFIMICPGGGYGGLAYDKEGTDFAKWLNGQGVAAGVLKYRLPEDDSNEIPHLTPLIDAKRGMEIIRSNSEIWGVSSNMIGVMGFSAGGHLASTLGTHFDESNRPDFMILIYPVVTMKLDYTHKGSRKNLLGENPSEELVEKYSNELQVKTNTPPTFIIHSQDDVSVPVENSLQLYTSLKEKKVPVEVHLYPHGGHGYAMGLQHGRLSFWREYLLAWLKELKM